MFKIVTFNVNSIKVRLQIVLDFLAEHNPDILLLQELKCETDKFPGIELEAAGYNLYILGQKAYNGVAILSKLPLKNIRTDLMPTDTAARYIQGELPNGIVVASLYLPNGNPMPSEKFDYKLEFMDKLQKHFKNLLKDNKKFIIGGDYNVIYTDEDAYNPKAFEGDALLNPPVRAAFKSYLDIGALDALRELHKNKTVYTWYSYRQGMFHSGKGILIDHFLISPNLKDNLIDCYIDNKPRAAKQPSDHVPLILTLTPTT
jgi:exodeoxyribonuclease-3